MRRDVFHILSRTDCVGTSKLHPFHGQRSTEVDDGRLRSIVGSLKLRSVDNVTGHGSCSHERAIGEVLKFLAVDVGALKLLALPVFGDSTSREEGTVKVGLDDLVVMRTLSVDSRTLSPWNARVCHKHIESTIEVLDSIHNGLLDDILISNVNLVSLACRILANCEAQQKALTTYT